MTHNIDSLIKNYNTAKEQLGAEAKKSLAKSLLHADLESRYSTPRDADHYLREVDQYTFDGIDEDGDINFESDNDYHHMSMEFLRDPDKALEIARAKRAEYEATRQDHQARLRNQRIRDAKETLQREGFDIIIKER